MASKSSQIDSIVDVVTPENIAFHYQAAGPFRRFPAFVLDLLIRVGVFAALAIVLAIFGVTVGVTGIALAGTLIFWFLSAWFYGGAFETWMNGQTPGKWVMGLRVLSVDGQPINGIQAVLRNILRTLDLMPIGNCMVGLVSMTINGSFQRLGDIVCGTMVVVEERKWLTGVAKLEDPRVAQLAGYLPADFVVSRTLARTLSAYIDRRRFFSLARRREVARHLAEPLLSRFGFPRDTSYDLLLCALYHRTFVAHLGEEASVSTAAGESPFSDSQELPPLAIDVTKAATPADNAIQTPTST
ncbi:MAG: hypothetical protein CMJ64_08715 [Planctomycetaceae bacterium]|nr:hypothetical protein [Planctomycetaceae bacterium]